MNAKPKAIVSWTPLPGKGVVMPNNTLAIPDTMVTDSGVYTCTAQNTVGTDTSSVILTVKGMWGFGQLIP